MMKAAFVANSERQTPQTYFLHYDHPGFRFRFVAVSGVEMAREAVRSFADQGFDLVDLCGDFDPETAEAFRQEAGGRIKVSAAVYSPAEMEKLNALEAIDRYGIIVMGAGDLDRPIWLEKENEEFNTRIAVVTGEETAREAAREMVREGIHFIELCSYFDAQRTEALSRAIGGAVPIGSCGAGA